MARWRDGDKAARDKMRDLGFAKRMPVARSLDEIAAWDARFPFKGA
jgi:hypothetical protein